MQNLIEKLQKVNSISPEKREAITKNSPINTSDWRKDSSLKIKPSVPISIHRDDWREVQKTP